MIDDVAGDVLLRAREVIKPLGDEVREALPSRMGLGRCPCHGGTFRCPTGFPFMGARRMWLDRAMALERELRKLNRDMILFDLVLGSGALLAPSQTLWVL